MIASYSDSRIPFGQCFIASWAQSWALNLAAGQKYLYKTWMRYSATWVWDQNVERYILNITDHCKNAFLLSYYSSERPSNAFYRSSPAKDVLISSSIGTPALGRLSAMLPTYLGLGRDEALFLGSLCKCTGNMPSIYPKHCNPSPSGTFFWSGCPAALHGFLFQREKLSRSESRFQNIFQLDLPHSRIDNIIRMLHARHIE